MDDRRAKLARMAKDGGTPNERRVAQEKLGSLGSLAIRTEETDDSWSQSARLIRNRNGNRAYLHGAALKYFLDNVNERTWITNRSIRLNEDFGSGDFYTILSWLLKFGLAEKSGTKYKIVSKERIRAEWNRTVDKLKLSQE